MLSCGHHDLARGSDHELRRIPLNIVAAIHRDDVRAARLIVDTYAAQKQLPKAGDRLLQLVATRPKSADLQFLLGQWQMSTGKMGDARKAFDAAKAANPKLLQADFALADLDIRENRTYPARHRLSAIAEADPKNVTALLRLANLDENSGNRSDAAIRYRAVLEVEHRICSP
jgi:predicted Zn-dependent protease